jgi:hypothetical protein
MSIENNAREISSMEKGVDSSKSDDVKVWIQVTQGEAPHGRLRAAQQFGVEIVQNQGFRAMSRVVLSLVSQAVNQVFFSGARKHKCGKSGNSHPTQQPAEEYNVASRRRAFQR